MRLYQNKYRTENHRLKGWNYGSSGLYAITICTKDKKHYFGSLNLANTDNENSKVKKSLLGSKAEEFWCSIPQYHNFVLIDEYIVMPNHLHGILAFDKMENPSDNKLRFGAQKNNLAAIIRGYKAGVKKFAKEKNITFDWQPEFYDRVIRNEDELKRFQQYIIDNPRDWIRDKYFNED
ncbi:transposase [soil metagenome]